MLQTQCYFLTSKFIEPRQSYLNHDKADDDGHKNQDHRFSEELINKGAAECSEYFPYANFGCAFRRFCRGEIHEVDARKQEYEERNRRYNIDAVDARTLANVG